MSLFNVECALLPFCSPGGFVEAVTTAPVIMTIGVVGGYSHLQHSVGGFTRILP